MKTPNSISTILFAALVFHLAEAAPKPAEPKSEIDGKMDEDHNEEEAALQEMANSHKDAPDVQKKNWKSDTGRGRDNNNNEDNESYQRFSGIRYTPQDLAEYIIKTRDEEGVALAIEELLQEGLIHRDEAIQYLESVKKELNNMKHQFALAQEAKSWQPNMVPNPTKQEKSRQFHAHMKQMQKGGEKRKQHIAVIPSSNESEQHQVRVPSIKPFVKQSLPATNEPLTKTIIPSHKNLTQETNLNKPVVSDKRTSSDASSDKDNVKEVASNALYEEYLLEKVIYQLAKDMFTQSLMKDDATAEQLLSKFASFLENELSQKRFSKATQEKILDTVSTALIESLRERLYNGN